MLRRFSMRRGEEKEGDGEKEKEKERGNGNAPAGSGRTRHFKVTRLGFYFFALTLGVGLAAIRTGNNLLFLVLGMMLGFVLFSGVVAELSLRGLELTRCPSSMLHACKPFLMGIAVRNTKRYLPSFSIEVEDILEGRLMDKRCYFLKIPAGRRQVTSYRHAFPRRGRYRFKGFRISTKFPFGLLRKSMDIAAPSEVLVYPAVKTVKLPRLGGAMLEAQRSEVRLRRQGDPFGLRDYRPGDDPRRIHHKISAHMGRPMVRECEDALSRRTVLYLDNALTLLPHEGYLSCAEGLEKAVSTAASLAVRLLEQGVDVGMVARSGAVPFGSGGAHLTAVLRFLALLGYDDKSSPLSFRAHAHGDLSILVTRKGVTVLDSQLGPEEPFEVDGAAVLATGGSRATGSRTPVPMDPMEPSE